MSMSQAQKQIIENFDDNVQQSNWHDWRWQLRHCVRTLERFEALLDVTLSDEQREKFKQTVAEFPIFGRNFRYIGLPKNLHISRSIKNTTFIHVIQSPQYAAN